MFRIFLSVVKWLIHKTKYQRQFKVRLIDAVYLNQASFSISKNKNAFIEFTGLVGCRRVRFNISDCGKISVGDHVFINDGTMLNSRCKITIGDRTLIGQNVLIYDHDHDYHSLERIRDNFLLGKVEIGKDVWIGSNAIILRGSKIGNGAVIGAGSVIKGYVAPNTLVFPKQELVEKKLER